MSCVIANFPRMRASWRLIIYYKKLVSQAPVLQYYDVTKPVVIQRDASGKGHGAVLLQDSKPVCYASRALTDTQTRYAPIEAEMLAVGLSRCVCLSQVPPVHIWQKYYCWNRPQAPAGNKKKTFVTSSIETWEDDSQSARLWYRSAIHSWE